MRGDAPARILLADDDEETLSALVSTLRHAGFEVVPTTTGHEAVDAARSGAFDLAVLDVATTGMDGLAATKALRDDPRTSDLPIILVSDRAHVHERVAGLAQGADDYVSRPFDTEELVARIRAGLRRSAAMRQVSPLTGLPGSARIEAELQRRIDAGVPFSLLYCDLNRFKAYNDTYGFLEGDRVLQAFADVVTRTVRRVTPTDAFVGHVGGDDFVVVTGHDDPEGLAADVCAIFDAEAPTFYDADARARGWIEVEDRRGVRSRIGFLTVDIGIAPSPGGGVGHVGDVVARATEMKHVAKLRNDGTSTYAVDRRTNGTTDSGRSGE